MTHVLQVLFLSVFILQVVMHGEEPQVPRDLKATAYLLFLLYLLNVKSYSISVIPLISLKW
jgi:hypothetical protein